MLTARTRRLAPGDPLHDRALVDLLPDTDVLSWVRGGDGIVGLGRAARFDISGSDRFGAAREHWRRLCQGVRVDDPVRLPGSGPIAFASMAFDDDPGDSVLVVPEVVLGRRAGTTWLTTIGTAEDVPSGGSAALRDLRDAAASRAAPVRSPGRVDYAAGQLSAAGYRTAVAEAVHRIRAASGLGKIVLAHDLLASTEQPIDARFLLGNLAAKYPACWTFVVEGLVGATPELLLERTDREVRSRVLAGSAWPHDGRGPDELARELLHSDKNRDEHEHAVRSVAASLGPFCDRLRSPAEPEVIRLHNMLHLATDITGRLDGSAAGRADLLDVLAAVHPTAAVGGTPTEQAVREIRELEGMDRGRYAGPVGWLDADGNGQFGIALRCAQLGTDGADARLFAGCGVVADSDPDSEAAEAAAKLRAVQEALESGR
ncbi:isochorismate synthase [Saccharopolyspora sp. HNM0983]|uniref:isochorismate synthase n=1 Tax=Saccharopolyspora montiporae TaxID=2781240 RepID=A0A929BAP6_9PSEU|nr:isochorismate synthase [Saccharopolyspora sp. HNM0983]MBE9374905.1 isochorismate synthase [Saccharopolyspora sp. HNM0983]